MQNQLRLVQKKMNSTRSFSLALAAVFLLSFVSAPASRSRQAPNVEARIDALIARMTLAEKLGQLQQLDG